MLRGVNDVLSYPTIFPFVVPSDTLERMCRVAVFIHHFRSVVVIVRSTESQNDDSFTVLNVLYFHEIIKE